MAKFYVQLGHNGHLVTEELLRQKQAAGVILSPVNYEYDDLKELAEKYAKLGGEVLCEPQLYQTRAYKDNLPTYPYFQNLGTIDFTSETQRRALMAKVVEVQKSLGVHTYMAPALWPPIYTPTWIEHTAAMANDFRDSVRASGSKDPVYAALPLHGEAIADPEVREHILNVATGVEADGFYLAISVPDPHEPLWTDFNSVYGGLAVTHGLKDNGHEVLLTHTNQASFMFMGAGADGFASGHFMNLRTFSPRRWEDGDSEGGGPQATRYYSPKLLNSFRVIPELEQLFARKLLNTVACGSPHAAPLFAGEKPSKVVWKLKPSWLHYLWSMNELARSYESKSAAERVAYTDALLAEAQFTHDALAKKGVEMTDMDEGKYLKAWKSSWTAYKADVLESS